MEVMVSAFLLIVGMLAILITYNHAMELSEMSRNISLAVRGAKSRMETIKNTDPAQMSANFHNVSFTIPNINGMGKSYIDDVTDPDLIQIIVNFSWRDKRGRVIGEDLDLDGVLDGGEDQNANGRLDSPVELTTQIFTG